jgi:hypothetical protein
MAKRVIAELYTFSPSTQTVTIIGKTIQRERLILILNVTSNTVIYNFSDTANGAVNPNGYIISTTNNVESTTIVLTNQCQGMSSSDKLSIIVDEVNESFQPAETYMDPVGKFRTSSPQALIDTDFEYGVQSTKWETIGLTNNRPGAFYDPTQGISSLSSTITTPTGAPGVYQITAIAGNGTRLVTVTINNTTGLTAGTTPFYIQDCTDQYANGWYLVNTVSANTSFTYYARNNVTNGAIFDSTKTYLFIGAFYSGAALPCGTNALTYSGTTITCTTTYSHGLTAGQAIYVVGTSASTNAPNGAWDVLTTPTSNQFTFSVINAPTGTISGSANAIVYVRTWGSSIHRAYDGGVTFTAGYPYHGNQLIRQTRRYFRYQSGKGIQFSTGSNMCQLWQTNSLISNNNVVTVSLKFVHNVGIGAYIKVSGADQAAFNGTFIVTSIPTDTTFTYVALGTGSQVATSVASSAFAVQPINWYGAQIRIGMFDQANGFFFQYDGQQLYAAQRNSTTQLSGYITGATLGSQIVTGTNTYFSKQLVPGDYIVVRGSSYVVISIESDTSITIYPDYRGTTISSPSQVIINKTTDILIPQNQWNIDRCDGNGWSSFNLDISKMQMWYMDYSWYGAGAIRWGFKDQRGEIKYVHRSGHANLTTEAYMRSGNMPARYEVNTFYPKTYTTQTVGVGDTIINVASTTGFPSSGNIILAAPNNTGTGAGGIMEYCSYSGLNGTQFTGVTRAVTNLTGPGGFTGMGGTSTAATFSYNSTSSVGVYYWGPQAATTIGHWGSSVTMDGRYDDDKSLVFIAGMTATIANILPNAIQPLISIRMAPSVDSGLTGILGQRELTNRMQLIMRQVDAFTTAAATTTTAFLITLRLNGIVSGGTFVAAGGSSLSQVAFHTAGQTITGGETMFGFFTVTPGVTQQDLSLVRDIGNSILGGGQSFSVPTTANNKYPDGPDMVTICAQNVTAGSTNSINARLSWTEAQA